MTIALGQGKIERNKRTAKVKKNTEKRCSSIGGWRLSPTTLLINPQKQRCQWMTTDNLPVGWPPELLRLTRERVIENPEIMLFPRLLVSCHSELVTPTSVHHHKRGRGAPRAVIGGNRFYPHIKNGFSSSRCVYMVTLCMNIEYILTLGRCHSSTFCIIYALDVPVAISTAISDIFLGVQPDKIWGMFFSSRVHSIDWSRYTDTSPFLLIIIWWSGVFFKCIIIIFLWLSFILPPTWSELYISSSVLILYVLVYRELIYLKRYRETVI